MHGSMDGEEVVGNFAQPKTIVENNQKNSDIKPPRKNLSVDTFSDSSSDTNNNQSQGGGSGIYKRLSSSNRSSTNNNYRKRTHNELFDHSRSNYNRDRNYRNYKYSGGDRSPRDHYDHYNNTSIKRPRYSNNNSSSHHHNHNNSHNNQFVFDNTIPSYSSVVPRMNNFKEYVLTLDDHVLPEDAVSAYYEYVKMYSNQQLDPFFKNYKQCDWLVLKYHPLWKHCEENFIRKCLQIRAHVFMMMLNEGLMESLVLDSNAKQVNQKLDQFLIFLNILLEGGTRDEVNMCKNELIEKTVDVTTSSINNDKDNNKNNDVEQLHRYDDLEVDFDDNPPSNMINRDGDLESKQNIIDSNVNGRHHIIGFNIRAIPVDASRDEIYNTYKDIHGFLRVYVSEPNLGRRDFRRAYVTFKSDANIREITDQINSTKFRDNVSLFVRPNHELTRRVKCEELKKGHTHTMDMILHDVQYVGELIGKLDTKYQLFTKVTPIDNDLLVSINASSTPINNSSGSNEDDAVMASALAQLFNGIVTAYDKLLSKEEEEYYQNQIEVLSENPILKPLLELHQQLLLGSVDDATTTNTPINIDHIKSILDPAILYLRIVYSIDYYALTDYPYEHLRNIRCSTITIRAYDDNTNDTPLVTNIDDQMLNITDEQALECYKHELTSKFNSLINDATIDDDDDVVDDEKASSITQLKDVDKEIETFIETNTQKITDEKFLCPLSMKKFKSPEYVRKHILAKHADKILQLRLDVAYFNNFVNSRYKNLPFSFSLFKKRTANSNSADISNKQLLLPRSTESNRGDHTTTTHRHHQTVEHPIVRNPRSYGRYRDIDNCDSMFDL